MNSSPARPASLRSPSYGSARPAGGVCGIAPAECASRAKAAAPKSCLEDIGGIVFENTDDWRHPPYPR